MYHKSDDSGGRGDASASSSSSSSSSSKSASTSNNSTHTSVQGSDDGDNVAQVVAMIEPVVEVSSLIPASRQVWKGHRFSPLYPRHSLDQIGWEVACCHPSHKVGGTACRRTYKFSQHGGAINTEKLLKHWCLTSRNWPDRLSHRDAPDPAPGDLRSLIELDIAPFEF